MCKAFICKQDEKHLPANGVWQKEHIFGKWQTNLLNGKQIWQNAAQLFGKIHQFQSW